MSAVTTREQPLPDRIDAQAARWKHNRALYPGWLILPAANRQQLWRSTENWILPILQSLPLVPPERQLGWLRELTWRYELCLMPLWEEYAARLREVLALVNPFPQVPVATVVLQPTDDNATKLPWDEIADTWVALSLALLRYERETMAADNFTSLAGSLVHLGGRYPEIPSFVSYERCLLSLTRLDHAEVRRILGDWEKNTVPDPFWLAKRASIRAEVGDVDGADKEATIALELIRESGARNSGITGSEDLRALSREGWAMMLVRAIKLSMSFERDERAPDFRARWEHLGAFRCNPWPELEHLDLKLSGPALHHEKNNGRRGKWRLKLGDRGSYQRLQPALQATRLIEEAGYPVRIGNVVVGAETMRKAARWLGVELPSRALQISLRLNDEKTLAASLSQHRVALLRQKDVEFVLSLADAALEQAAAVLTQSTRADRTEAVDGAARRVQAALGLILATIERLPTANVHRVLDSALELRRNQRLIWDHQTWSLLNRIVSRATHALSSGELSQHVLSFINQPLLEADIKALGASWSDDAVVNLLRPVSPPERVPSEAWDDAIRRLLRSIGSGPEISRVQSILRCAVLYRLGLLHADETDSLVSSLWDDAARLKTDLPLLPPWLVLLFPEPLPGVSVKAFKSRVLGTALSSYRTESTDADGSRRSGWRYGRDEDDVLQALSIVAWRPWQSTENFVFGPVSWTPQELDRLVELVESWWVDEGRELAALNERETYGGFTGSVLSRRLRHIANVFAYVLLPVMGTSDPAAIRANRLLTELQHTGQPIEAALPVLLIAAPERSDAVARDLRRSLSSADEDHAAAAIEAVYVWAHAAEAYRIPTAPRDLVEEIGSIIRTRRFPALPEALSLGAHMLRLSPQDAAEVIYDDVKIGLVYLLSETDYEQTAISMSEEESEAETSIPDLRGLAARLAAALRLRLGPEDDVVQLWQKAMETEPLGSVRRQAREFS